MEKVIITDQQLKAIQKAELKEERIYNRQPLRMDRLIFLNEAYSHVNNLDEIVDEIYNSLIYHLKLSQINGKCFQVGLQYNLCEIIEKTVDYDLYNYSFPVLMVKSKFISKTKFGFHLFVLHEDKTGDYENFIKREEFKDALFNIIYSTGPREPYSYLLTLNIPLFIVRGKTYCYLDVDLVIRHEIAHYYQKTLNPIYKDKDKALAYKHNYAQRVNGMLDINPVVKKLSYVLYFLTPTEVSANVQSLTKDLQNRNAYITNYKKVMNSTDIGKEYNKVKSIIDEIFNNEKINWDIIIAHMQNNDFFEKKSTLGKTKDAKIFKQKLFDYISDEMEYADEKFQKSIDIAIGVYKGKREDEVYSTHNTRITNNNIK
jgi:hypothetical protein